MGGAEVKSLPASVGNARDTSLIPGSGNGNPLQYSCLENSMDRGAGKATAHGLAKGWRYAHTQVRIQWRSLTGTARPGDQGQHYRISHVSHVSWWDEMRELHLCGLPPQTHDSEKNIRLNLINPRLNPCPALLKTDTVIQNKASLRNWHSQRS